ncbi:Uncharacterised protein [Raoultella ornithinolytica]|nr:Uncharacterised protein [Raoultella ornithinolytica]
MVSHLWRTQYPFGNIKSPFYNRRCNAHYDSSREENSGNVRAAVR